MQHHAVRVTLTLDDDVAAKLRSEVRRSGRSFRDVLNEALRQGMGVAAPRVDRPPFVVNARDLGALQPGLPVNNVGELLEQIEGLAHR